MISSKEHTPPHLGQTLQVIVPEKMGLNYSGKTLSKLVCVHLTLVCNDESGRAGKFVFLQIYLCQLTH